MKTLMLAVLLLPLVVGCKQAPETLALSPVQYRMGIALIRDEFAHQEITRDKGMEFGDRLQDGLILWNDRYGSR